MTGQLQLPGDHEHPLAALRRFTPARILRGTVGASYSTATLVRLRQDHAAAVDAVHAELDLTRDLTESLVREEQLFEVRSQALDKQHYLMRPDAGRSLSEAARELVRERCPRGARLQVVIGDGLSVAAVACQVPRLLPELKRLATELGWSWGQPFVIRYCRVGVMNEIGELLEPSVVVLLIGERPGLVTAESLSAYMAHRPRAGHTDAQRKLISNIHDAGLAPSEAAGRIICLATVAWDSHPEP